MRMNWTMSCHDQLHACTAEGATRVIILCLEIWPVCMHATSRCGDVIIRNRCSINSMLSIWYNNSSTDACLTFSPPHLYPNSPSISTLSFSLSPSLSLSLSLSLSPGGRRLVLKCQIYLLPSTPGLAPSPAVAPDRSLLLLHTSDGMTSAPPLFVTLRHPSGRRQSFSFFSRRRRGHPLPSTPYHYYIIFGIMETCILRFVSRYTLNTRPRHFPRMYSFGQLARICGSAGPSVRLYVCVPPINLSWPPLLPLEAHRGTIVGLQDAIRTWHAPNWGEMLRKRVRVWKKDRRVIVQRLLRWFCKYILTVREWAWWWARWWARWWAQWWACGWAWCCCWGALSSVPGIQDILWKLAFVSCRICIGEARYRGGAYAAPFTVMKCMENPPERVFPSTTQVMRNLGHWRPLFF